MIKHHHLTFPGVLTTLIIGLFVTSTGRHSLPLDTVKADGKVSNLTFEMADKTLSAKTTYTLGFTLENKVAANGLIHVDFYGPRDSHGGKYDLLPVPVFGYNYVIESGTQPPGLSFNRYHPGGSFEVKTASDIPAGSNIKLVISGVTNQASAGYLTYQVTTSDGAGNTNGIGYSRYVEVGTSNLKGRVTDPNGSPVVFAHVYVFKPSNLLINYAVRTDSNGYYGLGGMAPDTYTVQLSEGNPTGAIYFQPPDMSLTLGSDPVTQDLQFISGTKKLTGRVTRRADGSAVTDATIRLSRLLNYAITETKADTDSNGVYTVTATQAVWKGGIYSRSAKPDWQYNGAYNDIDFSAPGNETKTFDIVVDPIGAAPTAYPLGGPPIDTSTDTGTSLGMDSPKQSITDRTISAETKNCVARVLGDDRAATLSKPKIRITASEATKLFDGQCFAKQSNVLPTSYAPVEPSKIEKVPTSSDLLPASVTEMTSTTQNAEAPKTKVITGKGPAKQLIYLYIFSKPIIVAVKTDAAGQWSYTLNQTLSAGEHKLYVAYEKSPQQLVRSEAVTFTVSSATATPSLKASPLSSPRSKVTPKPLAASARTKDLGFISLLLLVFIAIFAKTRPRH